MGNANQIGAREHRAGQQAEAEPRPSQAEKFRWAAIGRETEAKAEPSLAEAKLSQPEVEPRQAESESGRESGRRAG